MALPNRWSSSSQMLAEEKWLGINYAGCFNSNLAHSTTLISFSKTPFNGSGLGFPQSSNAGCLWLYSTVFCSPSLPSLNIKFKELGLVLGMLMLQKIPLPSLPYKNTCLWRDTRLMTSDLKVSKRCRSWEEQKPALSKQTLCTRKDMLPTKSDTALKACLDKVLHPIEVNR